MASVIPGYEYDIFISYRHKDNKYDGWVTDFVENLSKELESTFKQDISIYFDRNTHDGLHETDDVNASLEPKLRSLIFIPIVSQTYCDSASFAWKNELLPFIRMANADATGLKIKNARGNMTSRILPVRIHELDEEDKKLFEEATGTVLRPVDFVYRTVGVNRPLRSREDNPGDNQNRTYYRDQISKLGGAIKDVIGGLQSTNTASPLAQPLSDTEKPVRAFGKRGLLLACAGAVLGILAIFLTAKYTRRDASEVDRADTIRTIAVMAFDDLSAGHDQEYFADGMSEEILNAVSGIPGFRVSARTSAFSFKGKNEDVAEIGKKLNVAYLISGSIRKSGDVVRIMAELVSTSTGERLWNKTYDGDMKNIFGVQEEIAIAVAGQLSIKILSNYRRPKPIRPETLNALMEAAYESKKVNHDSDMKALDMVKKAYLKDSTSSTAAGTYGMILCTTASLYAETLEAQQKLFREGERLVYRAISLDPNNPWVYAQAAEVETLMLNFKKVDQTLSQVEEFAPDLLNVIRERANLLSYQGKFAEAEQLLKKLLITDPLEPYLYTDLANALLAQGHNEEALTLMKKAIPLSQPDVIHLILSKAYLMAGKPDSTIYYAPFANTGDRFFQNYLECLAYWSLNKKVESDNRLKWLITNDAEDGAFQIAECYGWRGDNEKAIEWLTLAAKYKDPGLPELQKSTFLLKLHDDARFVKLRQELGL